jgi:hypothetical protein
LPQVGDKYYPLFTTVRNPELKGESELDAYIERECNKNLQPLHYRVKDLEVIEISSEELELHFETAY